MTNTFSSQAAPQLFADRRRFLGGLTVASVSGLSACSAPLPPLNVATWSFPGYEFLFLAREQKRFSEEHVRLLELNSVFDVRSLLVQGRAQVATLTLDEVLNLRSQGMDLRVVATLDQSMGADAVMVRPGLSELSALAGQTLALEQGSLSALMLDSLLRLGRLSGASLKLVRLPMPAAVAQFQARKVDAVITFEPYVSTLEQSGAKRLLDSKRMPGLICDVLVVRADVLRPQFQVIRQLVQGHFAALKSYREDPGRWSGALADRMGLPAHEVPDAFRGVDLLDPGRSRETMGSAHSAPNYVVHIQEALQRQGVLGPGDFTRGLFAPEVLESL